MPYRLSDDNLCVEVQREGDEWETLKCHDTEDEAKAHLAALNANVEHAGRAGALETFPVIRIKADWTLDVLGAPYGGPNGGKDSHGEYFSPRTNFYEGDGAPLPLVAYYHGYDAQGNPQGEPEIIGKTVKRWRDGQGLWFQVVLDKTKEYARRVWTAAQQGAARASTGMAGFMGRTAADGEITHWLIGELSIWDADRDRQPANQYAVARPAVKAYFKQAGFTLDTQDDPTGEKQGQASEASSLSNGNEPDDSQSEDDMAEHTQDLPDIQALVDQAVDDKMAELAAQQQAATDAAQAEQERLDAAIAAERAKWEQESAASRRLPEAPHVAKFGNLWQYDNHHPADLALVAEILMAEHKRPSENLLKAIIVGASLEENTAQMARTRMAMQRVGIPLEPVKANELNQSTLASYGDEWIGVAYSTEYWDKVRSLTGIVAKLPTVEVPQGYESINIPLISTSPTFYKVAQASAQDTNTLGKATYTVTSSKKGTTSQSLTVGKLGARTLFTGELEEDSIIPWASELMRDLQLEGAEILESLVIDGDTATGASANINDIAGTPGGTEYWLVLDGFRKLALVTNTANSRSAGALTVEDFLETIKLMGAGGKNAADQRMVGFILDPHTHWKALELSEVKTKDVFSQPTIENGMLTGLYGYEVFRSYNMHRASAGSGYEYKANTSGKIDQDTDSNNSTGAILAVRWDHWRLGWKRRMKIETQRVPQADATDIVALMRVGLVYRDTDASAISYNVTV